MYLVFSLIGECSSIERNCPVPYPPIPVAAASNLRILRINDKAFEFEQVGALNILLHDIRQTLKGNFFGAKREVRHDERQTREADADENHSQPKRRQRHGHIANAMSAAGGDLVI